MIASATGWNFELLAHRPYMTFSKYNPVAGGIQRFYEPIEVDFTPFIERGAKDIGLMQRRNGKSTFINIG